MSYHDVIYISRGLEQHRLLFGRVVCQNVWAWKQQVWKCWNSEERKRKQNLVLLSSAQVITFSIAQGRKNDVNYCETGFFLFGFQFIFTPIYQLIFWQWQLIGWSASRSSFNITTQPFSKLSSLLETESQPQETNTSRETKQAFGGFNLFCWPTFSSVRVKLKEQRCCWIVRLMLRKESFFFFCG